MSVAGLTGGIGMGKSTVASWLAEFDLAIIDTDDIARTLTAPGGAALPAIVETFSEEMITREGALDREKMAKRVFQDADERRALEAILHPLIRGQWQEKIASYQGDRTRWVVVVIPLLFETGSEKSFDRVVSVACREKEQMERLLARGWSREHALDRIRAQWPIEKKMQQSDFVIWTSCEIEVSKRQLAEVAWLARCTNRDA